MSRGFDVPYLAALFLGGLAAGVVVGWTLGGVLSEPSIGAIVACNAAAGRPGWDAARERAYVARQAAALNMSERRFRAIDYYDTCYRARDSRSDETAAPLRRNGSER